MKICFACNKPYQYSVSIKYLNEGKSCTHDKPWIGKYTPDRIKRQREKHAVDLLQPIHKGKLSRDYVKIYGEQKWMTKPMLRESEL